MNIFWILLIWKGEAIRLIGVRVSHLNIEEQAQIFFDDVDVEKKLALDNSIDNIRLRYGKKAIIRSSFLHLGMRHINGGVQEDYPMM